MKDKLTKAIREVPIADKTYPEYVEAIADKLIAEDYRKIYDDHERQCTCYALGCQMAEQLERKVAREIFEEIEALMNEVYSSVQYGCYSYGMTKQTDSPSAQRQCGKLEGVKYLGDRIAELKNKYIGESDNG